MGRKFSTTTFLYIRASEEDEMGSLRKMFRSWNGSTRWGDRKEGTPREGPSLKIS